MGTYNSMLHRRCICSRQKRKRVERAIQRIGSCWISAAALAERGLMSHWKGFGWLIIMAGQSPIDASFRKNIPNGPSCAFHNRRDLDAVLDHLGDVEDGKGHGDGDEQGSVRQVDTGACTSAESEGESARVELDFLSGRGNVSLGIELRWVGWDRGEQRARENRKRSDSR